MIVFIDKAKNFLCQIVLQKNAQANLPLKYSEAFYTRLFPLAAVQIIFGGIFFIISIKQHSEFAKHCQTKKQNTQTDDFQDFY